MLTGLLRDSSAPPRVASVVTAVAIAVPSSPGFQEPPEAARLTERLQLVAGRIWVRPCAHRR